MFTFIVGGAEAERGETDYVVVSAGEELRDGVLLHALDVSAVEVGEAPLLVFREGVIPRGLVVEVLHYALYI